MIWHGHSRTFQQTVKPFSALLATAERDMAGAHLLMQLKRKDDHVINTLD